MSESEFNTPKRLQVIETPSFLCCQHQRSSIAYCNTMSASEATASREFLQALIVQLRKNGADAKDVERVVEHVVPVLVPGALQYVPVLSKSKDAAHYTRSCS